MRKYWLLLVLLTTLVGVVVWRVDEALHPPAAMVAVAPREPAATQAPAGTPDGPPSTAPAPPAPPPATAAPRVDDVAVADRAGPIERILPRRSAAQAAGLDKVTDPLGLDSSAALVIDAGTRETLLAKNEAAVLPMASITKLMTGLVIVEANVPLYEVIEITDDDVDVEKHSRSRLKVGTLLSRDEALRLALMSSENRAAHALGRTYPGGLPAFVAAMNGRARSLGMMRTHYVDPTGLSSANQSSARDLATLVLAASRVRILREYSTAENRVFNSGQRALRYTSSNRLVKNPVWDISLQKTGYIREAGHCVVMRTQVKDRDLVMVLLDAGNHAKRSADAERIRHWIDPQAVDPEPARPARAKAKR
ncbi:serine hydrolase [Caenimonas sedimenti]